MKIIHSTLCFSFSLFTLACGNTATQANETTAASNNSTTTTTAAIKESSAPAEGIVGYWKLILEAYDDNGNRKLDDDERKKGIQNRYSFRFNADGTCKIMDFYDGHYERKTEGGKDMLRVFRNRIPSEEQKDPPPDVYLITSFSNSEMTLLETIGDHTFWVFKKQ